MREPWIPDRFRTRVTENGSTVGGLDHHLFERIGKAAHEVGELQRHGEDSTVEKTKLDKMVEKLLVELTDPDQDLVKEAVEDFIILAATHADGSRICTRAPHHSLASLADGVLYQASGLKADLSKVCP